MVEKYHNIAKANNAIVSHVLAEYMQWLTAYKIIPQIGVESAPVRF